MTTVREIKQSKDGTTGGLHILDGSSRVGSGIPVSARGMEESKPRRQFEQKAMNAGGNKGTLPLTKGTDFYGCGSGRMCFPRGLTRALKVEEKKEEP